MKQEAMEQTQQDINSFTSFNGRKRYIKVSKVNSCSFEIKFAKLSKYFKTTVVNN